jgi:hypothetical protein
MSRRIAAGAACAVLCLVLPAAASACTTITTSDGRTFTTQFQNQDLSGDANGGGCDVVAYYDDAASHTITNADVHEAPRFGVLVDRGTTVDVTDSRVFDIRNANPANGGLQQGVGLEYLAGSKGTVLRDQVFNYQKNGMANFDPGTNVTVRDSDFDGGGPTPVIARNGVQYTDHAAGLVRNNTIHDHTYTGCDKQAEKTTGCTPFQSAGLLLFNIEQPLIDTSLNLFRNNDKNLFNIPSAAVK